MLNLGRWERLLANGHPSKTAPWLRYGAHTIRRIGRWSEEELIVL
ncbi:MAG: hypothetical protein OXC61_00900 [Flavobacteriaceae bacterium]|nr:hypothetical protein [Flavobacteriaceae bacterium]